MTTLQIHIQNSEGVDVCFNQYQGEIELICDWNRGSESVEIYNMFSFSNLSPELIEWECTAQIENCRFRSEAQAAPDIQSIKIILGIEAVKSLMAPNSL